MLTSLRGRTGQAERLNDQLEHLLTVDICRDIHIRVPMRVGAAVKDRGTQRQIATRLDVASHLGEFEQIGARTQAKDTTSCKNTLSCPNR